MSAEPAVEKATTPVPQPWVAPAKSTPWTYEDLERYTPPDCHGFEILEGVLVVAPAPGLRHLVVTQSLFLLLREHCPPHLFVGIGDYDFTLGDSTVEPDVFVVDPVILGDKRSTQAPLLAVEVLSPSGRSIDLGTKPRVYADAGVPSYWVVDPREPSLTVFGLGAGGSYEQLARVEGEEAYDATEPFRVRVVPAALLADLPGDR